MNVVLNTVLNPYQVNPLIKMFTLSNSSKDVCMNFKVSETRSGQKQVQTNEGRTLTD